jgi:carboxyl-terminal processing protease
MRAASRLYGLATPGRWTRFAATIAAAATFAFIPPSESWAAGQSKSGFFATAQSIDLLGEVYRQVSENYVDPVDVRQLMFSGIDGMLDKLDPYTAFLDESESQELDELTSGQYAGIGITIGLVSGELYIMSVIEGNSAAKAGIHIGDRIISVNGLRVRNTPLDEVRAAIKGPAGTAVKLGISKNGERNVHDYVLDRAEVRVSTVSYSALFGSIGYVDLNSFGERSIDELREAVRSLQRQASANNGSLRGLVLDLRGNPGGLLTAAVEVAGVFLDKGSTVVSTRGRGAESGQAYVTKVDPLVPALPLAVLIDGDSASASEILAGAIQEHDRGVIVGEGSFGKGLVQSIIPLSYDRVLKLTTSKYYTPSGRLIQKPLAPVEGSRKVVIGAGSYDSTRVYFTRNRRKVYGGGGIRPDVLVRAPEPSEYEHALDQKGMFFKYANRYRSKHEKVQEQDLQGGRLLGDFRRFVADDRFTYRSGSRKLLDSLKVLVGRDYGSNGAGISAKIGEVEKALDSMPGGVLAGDSLRIASALRREVLRHYDENSARRSALVEDPVSQRAFSLLKDPKAYRALLKP